MSEEVKRMRYFDGLFLKEDEFNLEQGYHNRMRRLHNRYLHSWGIVWGLEIDPGPGPAEITVKEGMALNKALVGGEELSQEIILTSDTKVDLSVYSAGDVVYVYISYSEELADVDVPKGGVEKIHWSERALIAHSKNKPVKENENLILATVTIKMDRTIDSGSIKYVDNLGNSLRTYAGFSGEALATKKLTLNIEGVTSNLATIEGRIIDSKNGIQVNSPITNLSGDLSIQGGCTIGGDLTVKGTTTTVDTQNLVIEDNIITVNKYTPASPTDPPKIIKSGLEVYRGDAAKGSQVIWDESAGRWKMGIDPNLFDIVYGTDVLKLIDNASIVDFHRHNKLYGNPAAPVLALSVDNSGNVGIGTTTPDKLPLCILSSDTLWGSGISLDNRPAAGGKRYGITSNRGRLAISDMDNTADRLVIDKDGNVGIGTTTPDKLPLCILSSDTLWGSGISLDNRPAAGGKRYGITSNRSRFSISDMDNLADRLVIDKDGNVGIGTLNPQGKLDVAGAIRAGNSDIYFTEINHSHTGIGNTAGYAAIENATNYGALMILGRTVTTSPLRRVVKLWDYLEVNGSQKIIGKLGTNNYDPDSGYPAGWGGGIHTWDIAAHGTGRAVSGWQTGNWDLAEKFEKYDESLEPGDVVIADTGSSEKLIKSTDPYQDNLLGVISEKPGFLLGVNWEDPQYPIALALAGRVKVKVNMEGGPIREGDYLTSSSEESYAMKANRSGRVIGIALDSFDGSQGSNGKVVVFVNPHWWGGYNRRNT